MGAPTRTASATALKGEAIVPIATTAATANDLKLFRFDLSFMRHVSCFSVCDHGRVVSDILI